MKYLKALLFIPILALSSCNNIKYEPKKLDPNVTYTNVYLIMGQSNASGVSPYSYLENSNPDLYQRYIEGNSKVLITSDVDGNVNSNYLPTKFGYGYAEDYFGPEIGIADILSQQEETSYIIKASWGGSCLQTQYVTNDGRKLELYQRYISFIKKQINVLEVENKTPRIRGVFWMQGESDSFVVPQGTYYNAEKYFLTYLRADLNAWIYDHFNFVDAYIYTEKGTHWLNPEIINSCKQRLVDENEHCYCIKTNGEDETAITLEVKVTTGEGDDSAHYDSKSMLLLGQTAGNYLMK